MSQNDFNIADANGATVLADLNAALQALASQSSGSSAPSTTYPAQPWFDTTTGLLKFRNAANNAWVTFGPIADSSKFEAYVNNALAYDISTALVHTFAGTAALKIPVGTSAQRPTAVQGMIRYNTTISNFELYDGSSWIVLGTPADGSITYVKMATAAIATLAEIIAGTASKIVTAAQFKLGLRALESYTLLSTQTASASASLNFTSLITAEFDYYVFEFDSIVPVTNNVNFLARFSSNNGGSYLNANYARTGRTNSTGTSVTSSLNSVGATEMNIFNGMSNLAKYALCGTAKLYNPLSTTVLKRLGFNVCGANITPDLYNIDGYFMYEPTTDVAINAIQFAMSSGNFNGTIRMYGVRKT